jgi:hypothetical protein
MICRDMQCREEANAHPVLHDHQHTTRVDKLRGMVDGLADGVLKLAE